MSTHPIKKRSRESLRLLARVRALCLALPEVTEKVAWGEPTWRVHERLFAMFDDHHHGAAHVSVWLATERDAQAALIEAEPARFFRPAYVGAAGWVGAVLDGDCHWGMVAAVLEQAYQRVAAKAPARRRRPVTDAPRRQASKVSKASKASKASKVSKTSKTSKVSTTGKVGNASKTGKVSKTSKVSKMPAGARAAARAPAR